MIAAVVMGTCAVLAAAADSDEPVVAGKLGEQVEAAVENAAGPGFWGAVLVSKGGDIVFAKGYGMADFEKTPNTPRTLFELASVSKHVTAAAVLHLHQRGKLSLDDTLETFWKKVPADKAGVTVHHLLTHTSGLTREGVGYASPISRKDYVETIFGRPME
jgi:CubicO group peptidase (beta-lactamase class C family)